MRNLTQGPGGPFVPWDRYGARIRFSMSDDDGAGDTFEPIVHKVDQSPRPAAADRGNVEIDLDDPDKDRRPVPSSVNRGDRYRRDGGDDEIEIVTADDPKPNKAAAPQPGKDGDDDDDGDDDAPVSKRVQKRINKLTRAQREAERRAEAAEAQAAELRQRADESDRRFQQADGAAFHTFEQAVNSELAELERAYKTAYDAGDTDELWKIQRKLATVQGKADWIEAEKRRRPQPGQPGQQAAQPGHQQQPGQPGGQPRQQPQAKRADPVTMKWLDDNSDWFGGTEPHHRIMTASAYALDLLLKEEGLNPTTPEFWAEMNKRLDKEFPQYRSREPGAHRGNGSPVAGPSRGRPGGKQRVTLTRDQLQVAKDLGITPQDYAREVLKMENANGSAQFG